MRSPAALGAFLAAAASVLLGFATFCTPTFTKIWYYALHQGPSRTHFGTFGYDVNHAASGRHLGYPPSIVGAGRSNTTLPNPVRTISKAYVLVPIAFGLALLTFLLAIAGMILPVVLGSLAAVAAFIAAAVAIASFILIIVAYYILRRHFDGPNESVHLGTAFWFIVASAIALLVASLFFGLGTCCTAHGERKERATNDATMYNRLFAPQPAPEERINMEDMHETPKFAQYGHAKTDSYDTGMGSTAPTTNYYPPNQEVYDEHPGASSTALVAPVGVSYLDRSVDNGTHAGPPYLGPEVEPQQGWYNTRNSATVASTVEGGSEYEDAATAPSEAFHDARQGYAGVSTQRVAQAIDYPSSHVEPAGGTAVGTAVPHVGAYDPQPALPSHLRGGAVPQDKSDAWFLPTTATNSNELPYYQGGRPGKYPPEKQGSL